MYRRRKTLLSPKDALEVQRVDDSVGVPFSVPSIPKPRTVPTFPGVSTVVYLPQPAQEPLLSVTAEDIEGYQQQQQNPKLRRYSKQDIKTRSARASLPVVQRHKPAASYPIYSPSSHHRPKFSSSPPFLPWGSTEMMEVTQVPRLLPRTSSLSSASSVTSRSSFESRFKSPLSVTSSIEYWSSEDSWDQSPTKSQFLTTDVPLLSKKTSIESIVQRYKAGVEGRKQHSKLSKLGSGPPRQRVKKIAIRIPGEGFRRLPEEILQVVLAELKKAHLSAGSASCSTCWMRDLVNLGLSCTKWWSAVRKFLYEDIRLVGCDSIIHTKKKFKIKHGTRLTLLRRTLRSRPDLASHVKSLKVPAIPETAKNPKERGEYLDMVASLVMACPNLEKLPGFYQPYNHEFSRLVFALSTRKKLTEMVWLINASPFQRQHRYEFMQDSDYFTPVLSPSPLLPEQCHNFLAYHYNWSNLSTLFLHCNPGGTIDAGLFPNLLWSLSSLENLHVSSFPATSFNDTSLLSLPSLKTLRLENLPGITATGLSAYASPRRTDSMTSLSLISIQLLSLPVLARMFAHLKSLTRFTISQAPSITLPPGTEIFLHPYLASTTLQYLHWEFTDPDNDRATDVMAKAIQHGGFPALKKIRAPSDHEGMLQKLCRLRRQVELPSDRFRNMGMPLHPGMLHSQSTSAIPSPTRSNFPVLPSSTRSTFPAPSPTRSTFSMGHGHSASVNSNAIMSPTRSAFSLNLDDRSSKSGSSADRGKGMSLSTARKMAQTRIEAALTQPKFHIIIWDVNGDLLERFAVGGFMGTIESKINYSLKPDVEGSDEAIVGIDGRFGLLDNGEENAKEGCGCTGYWNADLGPVVRGGAKGRERWWHTERERWREVGLDTFF